MAHAILIATPTRVSLDMLRDFMRSLGGEEDEGPTWGIYLRLRVNDKEVGAVNVPLDTNVGLYTDGEIEEISQVIGAPPLSEIQISAIGRSGNDFDMSTEMAFQVAERMIAEWDGCISSLIGYSKGYRATNLPYAW